MNNEYAKLIFPTFNISESINKLQNVFFFLILLLESRRAQAGLELSVRRTLNPQSFCLHLANATTANLDHHI